MNIAPRMFAIANMIEKPTNIADIGCDHGKLSVFLIKTGRAIQVVASDISQDSLNKTIKIIEKIELTEKIKPILSDGFEKILSSQFQTAIIAGMGAGIISEILKNAPYSLKGKDLILSPMSRPEQLRRFLYENSFEIVREDIALDSGRYYPVICAVQTENAMGYSFEDTYLSKALLKTTSPHLKDYIQKIVSKISTSINGMKTADNLDLKKIEEYENLLLQLKKHLDLSL